MKKNNLQSLPFEELVSEASKFEAEIKWREVNGDKTCPECGARLIETGGIDKDGETYDALGCANGCNLLGYFGT